MSQIAEILEPNITGWSDVTQTKAKLQNLKVFVLIVEASW
jgi:hypothetical protein